MMTGNGWVRIPVYSMGLVPIGIGSAKIREDGDIEIILPAGKYFGQAIYQKARNGEIEGLLLSPRNKPAEEAKSE